MPRAIVFDLFGVIALPQSPESLRRIEGIAGAGAEELWEAYWALREPYDTGQPSEEYWAAIAARLGVRFDDDTVRALIAADLDSWSGVDPEMVRLVGELADEGRTLGLLSNIVVDLLRHFEERHGDWLAHFTERVYSCDIGVTKPDPKAYELAASRLGLTPRDCVFVDDRPVNVEAARATGMHAEVYRSPAQVRELLASLPLL